MLINVNCSKIKRSACRGYPCALWTFMHVVTVNEYQRINTTEQAKVTLHQLGAFILRYFTCAECAKHFNGTVRAIDAEVTSPDDLILFLWRKHNLVNHFLVSAPSSDPHYPKMQWPPQDLCPACRRSEDSSSWNEAEVLRFLQSYYAFKAQSKSASTHSIRHHHKSHVKTVTSAAGYRKVLLSVLLCSITLLAL